MPICHTGARLPLRAPTGRGWRVVGGGHATTLARRVGLQPPHSSRPRSRSWCPSPPAGVRRPDQHRSRCVLIALLLVRSGSPGSPTTTCGPGRPHRASAPKAGGPKFMADLGDWNYAIGFGALFLGLVFSAHPVTPLGRGRGVVVGMLGCFLIGLIWICTYYVFSNDLSQFPLLTTSASQPRRRHRLHGGRLHLRDPLGVTVAGAEPSARATPHVCDIRRVYEYTLRVGYPQWVSPPGCDDSRSWSCDGSGRAIGTRSATHDREAPRDRRPGAQLRRWPRGRRPGPPPISDRRRRSRRGGPARRCW